MYALYSRTAAGQPPLATHAVGALCCSDIPPSAIDFHVSNIIEEVLAEDALRRAAEDAVPGLDVYGAPQLLLLDLSATQAVKLVAGFGCVRCAIV